MMNWFLCSSDSGSDDEAPGLETELTEDQRRVAAAAGLAGDAVDKQAKQSRSEKKVSRTTRKHSTFTRKR